MKNREKQVNFTMALKMSSSRKKLRNMADDTQKCLYVMFPNNLMIHWYMMFSMSHTVTFTRPKTRLNSTKQDMALYVHSRHGLSDCSKVAH